MNVLSLDINTREFRKSNLTFDSLYIPSKKDDTDLGVLNLVTASVATHLAPRRPQLVTARATLLALAMCMSFVELQHSKFLSS
jgi:hypothetical protein